MMSNELRYKAMEKLCEHVSTEHLVQILNVFPHILEEAVREANGEVEYAMVDKNRTLGDRLGELVVEFSEGEVKSAVVVLQQMEDTTDHAYNAAAIQLAFVLTEFSGRE